MVGQNVANLQFKASSSASISINSGNNIGGAFSYFSEWDYFQSSTISGWTNGGVCYKMSYLYYYTNYADYLNSIAFAYSYKNMKGILCLTDTANVALNTVLTLSTGYLPAKWGKNLPGYGAYSQSTGSLVHLKKNDLAVTNDLILAAADIVFPSVGPNMVKTVG
jgi:hypothetical protein